ncbi:unnamed protein product [Cochlearia groenlandica]
MDSNSNNNNNKSIKQKAITQLLQGYKLATQLQLLIISHHIYPTRLVTGSDPDLVDELLDKILRSFQETISVLDDSFDHVAVVVEGSLNGLCGGGDDSVVAPASYDGGRKRLGVGGDKGKRGCYPRKKRLNTRIVEAKTAEDSYAWRKYGQKKILNTNFPRSYFRCTHKPKQGCEAIKHVQKQKKNPEMLQITYIGYHTCNANDQTHAKTELFNRDIIMDSNKTLAPTTSHSHVLDQDNNMISSRVKEEENNIKRCESSSTCDEDLSLVWTEEMMMFNHDDYDQNQHCYGETSTTTSLHDFDFMDNDQFSPF